MDTRQSARERAAVVAVVDDVVFGTDETPRERETYKGKCEFLDVAEYCILPWCFCRRSNSIFRARCAIPWVREK